MGRSGGGHTVLRDVRCCAAASAPPRATSALAGGVEMGWDGMGRDGARGGAQWQGRACGGMEGEGWDRSFSEPRIFSVRTRSYPDWHMSPSEPPGNPKSIGSRPMLEIPNP